MVTVGVVWIEVVPVFTFVAVQVRVWLAPAAKVMGKVVGEVKTKVSALPESPSVAVMPVSGIVDVPWPLFFMVMDRVAVVVTVELGKVRAVVPMPVSGVLPLNVAAVMMSVEAAGGTVVVPRLAVRFVIAPAKFAIAIAVRRIHAVNAKALLIFWFMVVFSPPSWVFLFGKLGRFCRLGLVRHGLQKLCGVLIAGGKRLAMKLGGGACRCFQISSVRSFLWCLGFLFLLFQP